MTDGSETGGKKYGVWQIVANDGPADTFYTDTTKLNLALNEEMEARNYRGNLPMRRETKALEKNLRQINIIQAEQLNRALHSIYMLMR